MAQPVIQTAFHSGEWAPALNARVDLAKYHAGAALLKNYFVDYRGGASSCPGTKYILRGFKDGFLIRLIPFAASFTVNYVLEFGQNYIRFYNNGAPVLETGKAITGITNANPGVITSVAHGFSQGDWVFLAAIGGMTQLNGKYYIVQFINANTFSLTDLFGVAVNTTAFGVYTAGGTASRVYTLPSPFLAVDLARLKFAQNVNTLVITHPSYVPYILTLISATNWTLVSIVFGSNIPAPTGMGIATSAAGTANFSYVVTAVDINGQESPTSAAVSSTVGGAFSTITVSWTAVSGALSYNVYRAGPSVAGVVPTGAAFGFTANVTGVSFADTFNNVTAFFPADFSETIPISKNPFQGAGVASATVTAGGAYTINVTLTFAAAPAGGATATGVPIFGAVSAVVSAGGTSYVVNDTITIAGGAVFRVSATAAGAVTAVVLVTVGSLSGTITNPYGQVATTGLGFGCTLTVTWAVIGVTIVSAGAGYVTAPAITFSSGAAAATAILSPISAGNPSVPSYFDQRLVLAAPPNAVQTFYMSQPGSYFNFNISNPIQSDDAITGSIVSQQLNTIKSMIPMPSGLVLFGDRQAWLVNGGSAGAPITPIDAKANAQAYNGASDVPPIVVNFDIIYVQAKGSYVRDLTFNFYTNIYTGTDISILSSHLFYGYKITEWAYAEEPFKLVWAVRNDGTLLSLTFVKEQELIGWAHRDTDGTFQSVASVTETVTLSNGRSMAVDAVYVVVARTINSVPVQYIERMAERIFPNGATDAWCVDAGLQYSGAPATTFSGGEHLVGKTVVGLADGVEITPFVMAATGNFTLPQAASKVTIGLAYTPDLQTLALDLGEPTIQGKQKKITGVTVRTQETLGLSIGTTLANLVAMKDLIVGNVGSQSNTVVTGLTTADAWTVIDPAWTEQGQYFIRQSHPFPSTILGVIPQVTIGNTPK